MDVSVLVLQATGGFVLGALIGYALRKAAKFVLALIAFALLPLFVLWTAGVLSVNWAAVSTLVGSLVTKISSWVASASEQVASLGVAGAAALAGLMFGAAFRHSAFSVESRRFVRRVRCRSSGSRRTSW